jgi:hypothetical protein
VTPAGEAHSLADFGFAQFSTGMRAVAVHEPLTSPGSRGENTEGLAMSRIPLLSKILRNPS